MKRIKISNRKAVMPIALALAVNYLPMQVVFAQEYMGASTMHGKTIVLPRGTTFEGRIDASIGSSKSKQGQQFTISMAAPLLANGADVLIPAGSQVLAEIVEAIPASEVPHPKGMKPSGKLRVQISGLRTPDGITYPLVASLTGETMSSGGRNQSANTNLGGGIAYVGTQSSFEAVAPGSASRYRKQSGQAPKVMTRSDVMNDPIYGLDRSAQNSGNQAPKIRSLVKRGRDIFIDHGSPVSIKLDAPFKIGVAQAAGAEAALTPQVEVQPDGSFGRRFSKNAQPAREQQTDSGGLTVSPSENPLPGILPDKPHGAYTAPAQAAPEQTPPPAGTPGPRSDF